MLYPLQRGNLVIVPVEWVVFCWWVLVAYILICYIRWPNLHYLSYLPIPLVSKRCLLKLYYDYGFVFSYNSISLCFIYFKDLRLGANKFAQLIFQDYKSQLCFWSGLLFNGIVFYLSNIDVTIQFLLVFTWYFFHIIFYLKFSRFYVKEIF